MATKAIRAAVAEAVIRTAHIIAAEHGPAAVRIAPLARRYGVSTVTVKRWLVAAGVDITHLRRGRPKTGGVE